jgi:hypothetical protein
MFETGSGYANTPAVLASFNYTEGETWVALLSPTPPGTSSARTLAE